MPPDYLDPRIRRHLPARPAALVRTGHAPLLLTPLAGLTRAQIDTHAQPVALPCCAAAAGRRADHHGRRLHAADPPHAARRAGAAEMRMVHADRQLQGPGRQRDAVAAARAGIRAVLEDSSGNGGAAVAAYAAAGGMQATIMAPASTSPAKTVQMRAHGATVELIPGTRQDTADAAVRRSETMFYASHNWHPFFLHGTKTLAYELWEDLGFRAPDNIITPCGAGSNVLGCEIGFSELLRAGQIDTMPRIFAAQPANCAPIAAAFLAGSDTQVPTEISPTIAEGTAIAQPIRLREVLGTLRETRGGAVTLTETEIAAPRLDLARIGIYVEPTAPRPPPPSPSCWRPARHAGADDGAGHDRQRIEGDAAHRGTAGGYAVAAAACRIALLGFSIECNRFAPIATEADFASAHPDRRRSDDGRGALARAAHAGRTARLRRRHGRRRRLGAGAQSCWPWRSRTVRWSRHSSTA